MQRVQLQLQFQFQLQYKVVFYFQSSPEVKQHWTGEEDTINLRREWIIKLVGSCNSNMPQPYWPGLHADRFFLIMCEKVINVHINSIWLACPRICENCCNLLSWTKFNHVMSDIHFFGLGSTALRSRAAPPEEVKFMK